MGGGACLRAGAFHCTERRQCGGGFCEATGWCSFPDNSGSCPSGRRYGAHAAEPLAGRCVDDACPANPAVAVRGGASHACVIRQNGAVACWGAGADGQLGDGTTLPRSNAAAIPTHLLGPVQDLALGSRHTCALLQDRTVWCWGANEAGQLGDGTRAGHTTPVAVRDAAGLPLTGVAALAVGAAFGCAARAAGDVVCWGSNADGELGQAADSTAPSLMAQPVATLTSVRALTARDRHVCALTSEHAVWCWGSNQQGELGDGTRTSRSTPLPVAGLTGHVITTMAAGAAHTCAVGDDLLWCWGANQLGELGDGSTEDRLIPTPVQLARPTGVVAAGHHTCAREEDGTVWCWGGNQAGQLGEGTTGNFAVPVPVTGMEDAADLAAGSTFSCARRLDGSVWCWGDNRLGQLGTGAPIERLAPGGQEGGVVLTGAVALSAGAAHSCALRQTTSADAADVVCWGDNQAGQLGDGTRSDRSMPVALKVMLGAGQVATGALHTCLRGASGGVWCWGRGGSGQLGTSAMIDVVVPTVVAGLGETSALAGGGTHSCALLPDRAVWCWGGNGDGQLGDDTRINRSRPAPVPGQGDVVELALGAAHTCARHGDGTVSCWGRGNEGQLGDGLAATTAHPVTVVNVTEATAIAAGANHSCALLTDRTVRCWGAGRAGQLGWGARSDHEIPSKVMNLDGVVQIAAGDLHTCARTSLDGRVETAGAAFCWGDNQAGQLGDGSHDPDPGRGPAGDPPLLNGEVTSIVAGSAHTCALKKDGRIVCWGSNSAGQLGDGATLQYPIAQPTQIPCP